MEILSDRYFFMKEESIWNGYHFYADKPYLAKTRIEDGEKVVSFMAENGCMELKEKAFKKIIDSWMLIDAYKCPCCERMSLVDKISTDYRRGGMFAYYVKDEIQNIRCFFNDEYHYFGLKIDYCPVCGGKIDG